MQSDVTRMLENAAHRPIRPLDFPRALERGRRLRRRKRTGIVVAAGVLCGAAALAATVIELPGADQRGTEAQLATVEAKIPVDGSPVDIAIGEGALWVVSDDDGRLWRIDPRTNQATVVSNELSPESGERSIRSVEVGEGAVWVHDGYRTLTKLDPDTGQVLGRRQTAGGTGLLAAAGSVWFIEGYEEDGGAHLLHRMNPASMEIESSVALGECCFSDRIVYAGAHLWMMRTNAGAESLEASGEDPAPVNIDILKVDPQDEQVVDQLPIDEGRYESGDTLAGSGTAVGNDVWFPLPESGSVIRIDASTDHYEVIETPLSLSDHVTATSTELWLASLNEDRLARMNLETLAVTVENIEEVDYRGRNLAAGFGAIWIADGDDGAVLKVSIEDPEEPAPPAPSAASTPEPTPTVTESPPEDEEAADPPAVDISPIGPIETIATLTVDGVTYRPTVFNSTFGPCLADQREFIVEDNPQGVACSAIAEPPEEGEFGLTAGLAADHLHQQVETLFYGAVEESAAYVTAVLPDGEEFVIDLIETRLVDTPYKYFAVILPPGIEGPLRTYDEDGNVLHEDHKRLDPEG